MAKNSQIEWTHHTFNPWWGCVKVSPACENCYAEQWAKRVGQQLWGKRATRRFFGDVHWKEPIAWNEQARFMHKRHRVFCASMADVFEKRTELDAHRERLWNLILSTPSLDWLLLTKRPENIENMVPWGETPWPRNVWLGTTVESERFAEERLSHLLRHAASVRFLSCEPLLGPTDLTRWFSRSGLYPIDWVIAGGESGAGARPMHPDWANNLLQQCAAASVPFHFKQWGHWVPVEIAAETAKATVINLPAERPVKMVRLPKKEAGRMLAGQTWNGLPEIRVPAHA